HVEADNAYGRFWALLAELAWRDYFDDPRTTAFGAEEFDRFPKGAGCFLASRELLVDAFSRFRSRYADVRMANDDAHALRAIAGSALGAAGLGVHAGRPRRDVEALAIAAPIYAVGHGLGMWRGLAELARARRRG